MSVDTLRIPKKAKGLRDGKVCPVVHPVFSREDADLRKFRWHMDAKGYARRGERLVVSGKVKTRSVRAHRIVLSRKLGRCLTPKDIADHENRNRLDCRRTNLSLATPQMSSQNRGVMKNNRAGFRGVNQHSPNRWRARVRFAGKIHYGGSFKSPEEAAERARQMRLNLNFHGET